MADRPTPSERPPLGSWARLYWLVVAIHVAMLLLLWWFTDTFNQPPVGS